MNWYVLFVNTGKEEKVEQLFKRCFDQDIYAPFIPMLEILFKISGKVKKELKPLFPGYLFIESEATSMEFIEKTKRVISASSSIVRILRYGDTNEIKLRDNEKSALLSLCNEDYCIESSRGIIVESNVHIKQGPLKGMESIIKKINRHKRQAIIELNFMGAIREAAVSLEILEKY